MAITQNNPAVEEDTQYDIDLTALENEDMSEFDVENTGVLDDAAPVASTAEPAAEPAGETPETASETVPVPEGEAPSEEHSADEAAKDGDPAEKTEATKEERALEEATQNDKLQSNYTNPIAQLLDMLGKAFGDNSVVGSLLTSVAAKMEKQSNPVAQENAAREAQLSDPTLSAGVKAKQSVVEFTMTSDDAAVVSRLAEAGTPGTEGGYLQNPAVRRVKDLVAEGGAANMESETDALTTADAILRFNNDGMAHINHYLPAEDAAPEIGEQMASARDQATQGLKVTNAEMVEQFYRERMKEERAGKPLSDEMKAKMALFDGMEGIEVDYEHWHPGVDISVAQTPEEAEAAALVHAQAVTYEGPETTVAETQDVFTNGTLVNGVAELAAVSEQGPDREAIVASVKEQAAENPLGIADAITQYSAECSAAITAYDEGDEVSRNTMRGKAMSGLGATNSAMVEGYYSQMMEFERRGETIPEDVMTRMKDFEHLPGVSVDYEHWYPGCDVSVPIGADAADAAAARHKAALEYGPMENDELANAAMANPELMQEWKEQAEFDFAEGNYGEIADSATMVAQSVRTAHNNLHENLMNDVENRNELLADDYMAMSAGLQTYYNTSVDLIENSGLDAAGKDLKQEELQEAMKSQVTELYTAASADDLSLGKPVFNDAQREAMNLQIPGVNVEFKDFKAGMDLTTGRIPEQEIKPVEEMSLEEMARVDQKNPSDKEMEGFGYEVMSAESSAETVRESVFVEGPSPVADQSQSRTGAAQRKTAPVAEPAVAPTAPEATTPVAPEAGKNTATSGSRGAQAEELFGNIGGSSGSGKSKGKDFQF